MRIVRYEMQAPNQPLVRVEAEAPPLAPGEVLIEVAGCGVCRTDIGFLGGSASTSHPLPITLGHEVAGVVEAAGDEITESRWLGRAAIVPSAIPCGTCSLCQKGIPSACRKKVLVGDDIHGGFASHLAVPARGLCPVPGWEPGRMVGRSGVRLAELSVLADPLSIAYHAVVGSGLQAGMIAVFVGVGGIGGFGVQIARAFGAEVVALDPREDRLERARGHGASLALDPRRADAAALRESIRGLAGSHRLPEAEWRIFETSGTAAGRSLAFALLTHGSHLSLVGPPRDDASVRLGDLAAFGATACGVPACPPSRYVEALRLALEGRVLIAPFVERRPLATIQEVLREMKEGAVARRPILVPDVEHGGAT